MGDVVNLREFRKAKKRAAKERQAAENRESFGRTKADRELENARRKKDETAHDGHRIESDDDGPQPA
ncbi:MAG: DUF4169 family protein [Pseudomonadota bacterium]